MSDIRIINCVQGSAEWWDCKEGLPSASEFLKIITPKTGKLSSQAVGYAAQLIHEAHTHEQPEELGTFWMDRGKYLEPEALALYEFETGLQVTKVGFVTNGRAGCSPDGLVGDEGGLELKCPMPHTHIGYLIGGGLPDQYRAQVHGSMAITGRDWWDFMSYHPDYRPLRIRVLRDEYTEAVGDAVDQFCRMLEGYRKLVLGG